MFLTQSRATYFFITSFDLKQFLNLNYVQSIMLDVAK